MKRHEVLNIILLALILGSLITMTSLVTSLQECKAANSTKNVLVPEE